VNGYQSRTVALPANASSSSVYLKLETPSNLFSTAPPWSGDVVVAGGYYEILEDGQRKPGYGHDSIAHGGWSARSFLDRTTPMGLGSKWGLTVLPSVVNIMVGHNQSAAHQTQLDAGTLTGDYTDDMVELIDLVRRGLAVARNMTLDWESPTIVMLTTPWRAAASSPMANATNAATINTVNEALCEQFNLPHISLYSRFNATSPIAGLHPGDSGDGPTETGIVSDGWVLQIQTVALLGGKRLLRARNLTRPTFPHSPSWATYAPPSI
jgi:hypothetical protein